MVHWNLPANPVDFEQRVDRYKVHAIRNNVAAALTFGVAGPWNAVFQAAVQEDRDALGDLNHFWMYPGEASSTNRGTPTDPGCGVVEIVAGVAGSLSASIRPSQAGGHDCNTPVLWHHAERRTVR